VPFTITNREGFGIPIPKLLKQTISSPKLKPIMIPIPKTENENFPFLEVLNLTSILNRVIN
jgi:hypothetical protein